MKINGKVVTGVLIERDGYYWGTQYDDGHSTSYGFGGIDKADIRDSEFVNKPEDMVSPRNKDDVFGGVLRTVTKMTEYELG